MVVFLLYLFPKINLGGKKKKQTRKKEESNVQKTAKVF